MGTMMAAPARCGRPTVKGHPCRRTLIPFGPHWICPVHLGARQPALICSHPGKPHTARGKASMTGRDRLGNGGAA
jgi:hypothetical protein